MKTVEEIRSAYDVDYTTGEIRCARTGAIRCASRCTNGYMKGKLGDTFLLAHRVVYAHFHGEWPDVVDHVNRDKADNRISNLRSVSQKGNCANRAAHKGATSQYKGVCFSKAAGRWQASIKSGGKQLYLGQFDREDDAALAYNFAAIRQQGEIALLNVA